MRYQIFSVLTLFIGLATFTSCTKENKADAIYITFHNDTGVDMFDLSIPSTTTTTEIGNLTNGQNSAEVKFTEFQTADDLPHLNFRAKDANGENLPFALGWCGTGVTFKNLDNGHYTIRLFRGEGSDDIFQEFE